MYKFLFSSCATNEYPISIHNGFLASNNDCVIYLFKKEMTLGDWGEATTTVIPLIDEYSSMPDYLNVSWLSITENKFYAYDSELPSSLFSALWKVKDMESQEPLFSTFIVGLAPYGQVALWISGMKKSVIVTWDKGREVKVEMADFVPTLKGLSQKEYCNKMVNQLRKDGFCFEEMAKLPSGRFDNFMKQFFYRYMILFEKYNFDKDNEIWEPYKSKDIIPVFDYLEESLFDGTHDKLHDDGLLKYHTAGMPKKLAVNWHVKKSDYTAYFWFEEEKIREVFEKFYGAHPETKTDFNIRIDSEKRKIELSLYRYGLKEPIKIREDAYQLIVFKNKFEYYRSDNYNQPRGAWIW